MLKRRTVLKAGALAPFAFSGIARAEGSLQGNASGTTRTYGLTMLDALGLPATFAHFPYANPDAPKGGDVALAAIGSFDSFNPFIVRGTAPSDITRVWDTLLRENADEAGSAYGHLVQTIELPEDRSYAAYELRPEARFHDGKQVTAEDVAWTFDTLRTQGRPYWRAYYADVDKVVAESPARVVFHFKPTRNRELPLILGQLPVLPKHWWQGRDFTRPLTDPPLGSGAYQLGHVDFGRTLIYTRVADYWAANLPTGRGLNNFGSIRSEYFRDGTVAMEAFKSGQIDFRRENIAKQWATAYNFPAAQKGLVKKEALPDRLPTGMQGFAMNTRRAVFKNPLVRQAMTLAFDFEWCNRNLFFNSYTRTKSYYSNSDLASSGLPSAEELALLDPHKDKLPPELFTQAFTLPVTDGSGNNRDNLRKALKLLKQAGWSVKDLKLVDANGQQMAFEILLFEPAFERVSLPYVHWLSELGIAAHVRTVDPAQYQHLMDDFDFDMTVALIPESESPGNEQTGFWTSGSAKAQGSDNVAGVADPVVDELVGRIIGAPDRKSLVTACHALDRVLLWNWYMVPHWHLTDAWVAYWDRFGRVQKPVRTGVEFEAWWIDPARAAATDQARRAGFG